MTTFADCMALMGWRESKGEICTQQTSKAGHGKAIADIVIKENGIDRFVIEIKRPSHIITSDDEEQLFSYMRLRKVPFGIYVGRNIQLYYEDTVSQKMPCKVFAVAIADDNPDGVKFVELFSKDTFNVDVVADFCNRQVDEIAAQKEIQAEVQKFLQDTQGSLFKEAMKSKLTEDGRSSEWADKVLEQINLRVLPVATQPSESEQLFSTANHSAAAKRTVHYPRNSAKYSISGSQPLNKRKLILAIVTKFVSENRMTYKEYTEVFRDLRPGANGVIKRLSEIQDKLRWFAQPNECLVSTDGVTFCVNSQWSYDVPSSTIIPVIKFANRLGYNVVEVSPNLKFSKHQID